MKEKIIWYCQQFLGVPIPDEPFPNVNDTPTMLDRIRWIVNSFKSKTKLMNCKMKEHIPRKFKRIVAGTWAITVGLAGIVAYQLIWALNAMLFYSFCIFSILSLIVVEFHFGTIKNTRERWQPMYWYNWGNIVKPCLGYFRQRENKLIAYISATKNGTHNECLLDLFHAG